MPETGPQDQPDEATMDLLIKQVIEGLSPAEERALDVLDSAVASAHARDLERAAAAITLAGTTAAEPLPRVLRERIEAEARAFFASAAGVPPRPAPESVSPQPGQIPPRGAQTRRGAWAGGAGWWAAAACLVLAVAGWLRSPSHVAPTLAEQRAALIARPDSVKINFGATKEPAAAGVSGDVVWDPAHAARLHPLRRVCRPTIRSCSNTRSGSSTPSATSATRSTAAFSTFPPMAAEVHRADPGGIPVRAAKAFAVTIEKPGGVVVSAREHIVALAQAG